MLQAQMQGRWVNILLRLANFVQRYFDRAFRSESLHSLDSTDLSLSQKEHRHGKLLIRSYSREGHYRSNLQSLQAECRDHTESDVVVARHGSSGPL